MNSERHSFHSVTQMGDEFGKMAEQTVSSLHKAAMVTVAEMEGNLTCSTHQLTKVVTNMATEFSNPMNQTMAHTNKVAIHAAMVMGAMLEETVVHASKAIVDFLKQFGTTTTKHTYQWVEHTTKSAGKAIAIASDNPLIRRLSGILKLEWLLGLADQVDVQKATAGVRSLQQRYPHESPSQIAHRLMVEKAMYGGGMGFVSSFLPGTAAALLAVDLAATTVLQTELVYQIAFAYGLDLTDPARRGELLAIFGLALGGRQALKAGLGLLRTVPLAGAVIGASTNATMLYSVGYAACRFYEAKLQESAPEPAPATLETIQADSDVYLEAAIAQQTIMDQLLVHLILARYPERPWAEILPSLAALQLSPASLDAIAANIQSPKPLHELLNQLNRDYAISLLAQGYRMAKLHPEHSQEFDQMLSTIAERFDISMEIEMMVEPT